LVIKHDKEVRKMEEIDLNGQIYYLKEDVERYYSKKSELLFPKFDAKVHLCDACNVIAIGNVTINDNWRATKVSLELLRRAVKIVDELRTDEGSVTVAITKDYPLLMGAVKDSEFSGVVIAPRVSNE